MTPEQALELATRAHAGQTDKVGRPYIEHPVRVAGRLDDPDAQVVALLHDVLEDTDVDEAELVALGVTDPQLEAIRTLTHHDDVDNDTYWQSVRAVPLARLVKVADLADNCDPARVALLDPATAERLRGKYRRAFRALVWDEPQPEDGRPTVDPAFRALFGTSIETLGTDLLESSD